MKQAGAVAFALLFAVAFHASAETIEAARANSDRVTLPPRDANNPPPEVPPIQDARPVEPPAQREPQQPANDWLDCPYRDRIDNPSPQERQQGLTREQRIQRWCGPQRPRRSRRDPRYH